MIGLKNFLSGVTNRRVDYATRHYSKAYDWGQKIGGVAVFIVLPVGVIFGLGFALGRYF